MNENGFLTVKQVADYAGISAQSVYDRLEKDFKPYLKIEKGKKQLNKSVLEIFAATKMKPILSLFEK